MGPQTQKIMQGKMEKAAKASTILTRLKQATGLINLKKKKKIKCLGVKTPPKRNQTK